MTLDESISALKDHYQFKVIGLIKDKPFGGHTIGYNCKATSLAPLHRVTGYIQQTIKLKNLPLHFEYVNGDVFRLLYVVEWKGHRVS